MKTAILHLRHTKLSAFWSLTVPYLTATNDHTQDRPTRTYSLTLAVAHTSMHVRKHMYVRSRTTVEHLHSCAHTHSSCAQPHICTRTRICKLTCKYKFMHMRTQPNTRAGIYAQSVADFRTHNHAVACMHAYAWTLATHTRAHTVVHSHSSTHTRPLTLVNAHSWTPTHSHALTHAHMRTHIRARTQEL